MSVSDRGLQNRVAIVTGAARGIGLAIATKLVADGARVAIADVDKSAADAAAAALGLQAVGITLDVTNPEHWAAAHAHLQETWDAVSILVNCAGIAGRAVPSWELSIDEWKQVINIDLTGVFVGCHTTLPGMIERGYGRIVNIASIAGKEGNPNASAYSAAKAGVIGLTKSIAKEVAT
ncbi:MAG: SDR family oxidoreductase, partial [Thermomicrobiales bacterium]